MLVEMLEIVLICECVKFYFFFKIYCKWKENKLCFFRGNERVYGIFLDVKFKFK